MFHTVIVVGRLGKDPEMRYTPSGQAVTSFSVATDRQYTGSDGQQVKETVWFRVSVWGKQAESCNNYLQKGKMVLVEGRLTTDGKSGGPRVWKGQDGEPRASFEISATNVRFLSTKSDGQSAGGDESFSGPVSEEEIPF
ncbi:MAG: single-stranded DNA-binding protein [Anaerolineaceae bacterium]|jgi:single-strand DNA-binding protein|nr:single-stranded DNA-binding protein [Anaerolineaceae bacterium]